VEEKKGKQKPWSSVILAIPLSEVCQRAEEFCCQHHTEPSCSALITHCRKWYKYKAPYG